MDTQTKTPRRRLFDHADSYTTEGGELDTEVNMALRHIVGKWVNKGISIRDIQYVIQAAVQDVCIDAILGDRIPTPPTT